MRTNHSRLTHVTIATGVLALAMAAATPSFADGNDALKIRAVAVHGNRVSISVANVSARPSKGTVSSRVRLPNGSTEVTATVSAAPGQTVTVDVALPARSSADFPFGVVVDDGVPF